MKRKEGIEEEQSDGEIVIVEKKILRAFVVPELR